MADTPFFPAWSARFNPVGSHSGRLRRIVSALTLCQLEKCFAPWIPTQLFPKAANHQNSRDRYYSRREPRAVKRRKNKYPRLDAPRHKFRDHLKRHDRRKISRLRKLGLM